jgi:hypothetical protein
MELCEGSRIQAWPPSDDDLRMIAAITSSSMDNPEYGKAVANPAATVTDSAIYDYLSRAVVRGERLDDVFPAGDSAGLAVRITAAMLVAFMPARPWQGHLELIWKLETDERVKRRRAGRS